MFAVYKKNLSLNFKEQDFPFKMSEDEHSFAFKNIAPDFLERFNKYKQKFNSKTNLNNLSIIKYWDGLGTKTEDFGLYISRVMGISFHNIPKSYLDFIKVMNGINIKGGVISIFGSNSLSTLGGPLPLLTNYIRYDEKQELFNIGMYSYEKTPIYMDTNGNILVIKQKEVIASFKDIEKFITHETKRIINLFIEQPFGETPNKTLPNDLVI